MTKDQADVLMETVGSYYSKIIMNKMSVEEILQTLEKDLDFLRGQYGVLEIQNIIDGK